MLLLYSCCVSAVILLVRAEIPRQLDGEDDGSDPERALIKLPANVQQGPSWSLQCPCCFPALIFRRMHDQHDASDSDKASDTPTVDVLLCPSCVPYTVPHSCMVSTTALV